MTSTEEVGYEIVEASSVPILTWLAAERALFYCARDLGLPLSIQIVWIRPTAKAFAQVELLLEHVAHLAGDWDAPARAFIDAPLSGQARSLHLDEIRIRADLSVGETVRVVGHECQHIADFARYRWPETTAEHEGFERHAREYEERVASRFSTHTEGSE